MLTLPNELICAYDILLSSTEKWSCWMQKGIPILSCCVTGIIHPVAMQIDRTPHSPFNLVENCDLQAQ